MRLRFSQGRLPASLSVVTLYNDNFSELLSTGASLNALTHQWVVVNGGYNNHEQKLKDLGFHDFIYLPGPDSGIYNGFNRGIKSCTGEFVWFLNAGDISVIQSDAILLSQALSKARDLVIFRLYNLETRRHSRRFLIPRLWLKFGISPLPHQAIWFNRKAIQKIGEFNETIGLIADQEYIYRALCSGRQCFVNKVIAVFEGHGRGSKLQADSFQLRMQNITFIQDSFGLVIVRNLIQFARNVRRKLRV